MVNTDNESSPTIRKTKKLNRCDICNKKVGVFSFKCKCNGIFCSVHRYSETHSCPFDYKGEAKEQLAKSNPVIAPDKVSKC